MTRPSSGSNERRNASSSSRSSSILLIPDAFLEGLALEVSILDALLQRHRCSHGRTIYFRRMQMALKPLLRHELEPTTTIGGKITTTNLTKYLVLVDAVHRLRDLLEKKDAKLGKKNREKDKDVDTKNSHTLKHRKRNRDEPWNLESLQTTAKTIELTSTTTKTTIEEELQFLVEIWTHRMPEILSRIHHASKAILVEITRGFFYPFLTTALSALARIRAMVMQIGTKGLTTMIEQNLVTIVSDDNNNEEEQKEKSMGSFPSFSLTDREYQACTNHFLEDTNNEHKDDYKNGGETKFDQKLILRSIGLIEKTTTATTNNSSKSSTISAETSRNRDDDWTTTHGSITDDHDERNNNDISPRSLSSSKNLPPKHYGNESNAAGIIVDDDDDIANQSSPQKRNTTNNAEHATISLEKKRTPKSKALLLEAKRANKKRKSKDSTKSSKRKKSKKPKADFFDQLFD